MKIIDHKLEGCWHGPSPNAGGKLVKPSLLVMHFTASGGAGPENVRKYLMSRTARASAHVIVGRNAKIEQIVAFNVRAWHAGKSIWRGVPNGNDYSIGIEIDNWGALTRTEDGTFRSWTNAIVPPERVTQLRHRNDGVLRYWEIFPEQQLDAVADVTRTILAAHPGIREIVGHDDIAPGRKIDPGPAFPLNRFTSLVTGRDDKKVETRKVIAAMLNLRGGPGTRFEVIGQLPLGTEVIVLYNSPDPWAQVTGRLPEGREVTGWVADQYLR